VVKNYFFFLLCFVTVTTYSQKIKKDDRLIIEHLEEHIRYLADDKLEGRRTGTAGEKLAAAYISKQFDDLGLSAKGNDGFYQTFDINEGKQIDKTTQLSIEGNELQLNKDYFPLVYSANTSIDALPSIALQESGMPWIYDLKEMLDENAGNPHFDISAALQKKALEVQKRGGTALLVFNTSSTKDDLAFDSLDRTEVLLIPVVYVNKNAAEKYFSDATATIDVKLKTAISQKKRTGTNVIGYIDNGAAHTVILGAHYDHLGRGEDANSREVEQKMQIHNGADDNASGTAALIELARLLKASKGTSNYLFIAFSGEELGLFGSKYFTQHPTVDLSTVKYMINMDMIGRLNDASPVVTVGGYGTSPFWPAAFNEKGKKQKLYAEHLSFHFDSSGTGPSDHTSFYLKNIPVLFYFTGLHSDYHKPTDDYDKINYTGEMFLVKHILSVIKAADRQEQIPFLKTRETQTSTSAKFSVTLGIMPDYTFSEAGVRVDGVTDNKPAQKAGVKAGDVIIALGDHKINSLENYMQALALYKKGDKTTVTYKRGELVLMADIVF
jgi:hypothetical protein